MDKQALLMQHFGHSSFRPGQEALMDALLAGRDVLGVMPTGAGKSACYQVPALLLPGVTLVISPLISLMKDQVTALTQAGISAGLVNSSLSAAEQREVLQKAAAGVYKILYVAPERLTAGSFLQFASGGTISMVAVDEAHCVSQWGQDFRPSYLDIAGFISGLERRPVVGAFTATATKHVKEDMEKLLGLRDPFRVTTGFDRPNLYFEVVRPKSKMPYLLAFLASRPDQSGIVYCATRKAVESVCENLQEAGISAAPYHAGLPDEMRRKNQEDFAFDRVRVMAATNAFGMGIDKSNISFVVHYNMPKNIESYYQEAGRAGRDGSKAHCTLLFAPGDVRTAQFLIENSEDNDALSPEDRLLVRQRDMERLRRMTAFCKTTGCLRQFLLEYFGDTAPARCENCGSCTGEMIELDMTIEAQKILSGVARVEKQYRTGLGLTTILKMLHGSTEQRVLQLNLHKLTTYGILKEVSTVQLRAYVDFLLEEGYLTLCGEEYPVLRLTPKANEVLFRGQKVQMRQRKQSVAEQTQSVRKGAKFMPAAQSDSVLLQNLKQLRTRLAAEENVPAYMVFSNAALLDMASKQPVTLPEFLLVSGVGRIKADKYGDLFLREIRRWRESQQG